MPVQLTGLSVTLPSVGVSLTPTTLQLPWSGESLIGLGVSLTSAGGVTPSSLIGNSSASLNFSIAANSQYIPLLVP